MEILHAFDMRSSSGEIEIVDRLPDHFDIRHFPLANVGAILSPVVSALYQQFEGNEFAIWIGDYFAHRNGKVRTRADLEAIELSIGWRNKFAYQWKGVCKSGTTPLLFSFSYSSSIDITTQFTKGFKYRTVDFHFSRSILHEYAKEYDHLRDFMEKVDNKRSTTMDVECSVTPVMQEVINSILSVECKPAIRKKMMGLKAEELLIFALEAIENTDLNNISEIPEITDDLRAKVFLAKDIFDAEMSSPPTVVQLAERVGSNPRSLQIGFRICLHKTVYQYCRLQRLELAKELLTTTSDDLHEIADRTGYNDSPYLINAFKKEFGLTPDEYRRLTRKKK